MRRSGYKMLQQVVLLASLISAAQAVLTIGTDFVVAFPCSEFHNDRDFIKPSLIVINSNSDPSTVTVTAAILGFTTIQQTVVGNSALQINFTSDVVLVIRSCDLNITAKNGFSVQTSRPVALYARMTTFFLDNIQSQPQYLILPTNLLGSHYIGKVFHYGDPQIQDTNPGIIVAQQDGTIVTVGDKQITLNRLETYFTPAANTSANVPFAYIRTLLFGSDAIMALPISFKSRIFMTAPTAVGGLYEIWAFESDTTASINGGESVTVHIGSPYMGTTTNGQILFINASKQSKFCSTMTTRILENSGARMLRSYFYRRACSFTVFLLPSYKFNIH